MKRILAALAILSSSVLQAQSHNDHDHNHLKCTFDQHYQSSLQNPETAAELIEAENAIFQAAEIIRKQSGKNQASSAAPIFTIPVVVHIIYANQSDNISMEKK